MRHGGRWGALTGLAMGFYFFLLALLRLDGNDFAPNLDLLILGAGIWMAHRGVKRESGGAIHFWTGLVTGAVVTLGAAVVSRWLMFLTLRFVSDRLLRHVERQVRAQMAGQGMGPAEIDQALAATPLTAAGFAFGTMFFVFAVGILLSVLISVFTRTRAGAEAPSSG